MNSLEPKLFSVIREGYNRKQFGSDLVAGIVVGIVALPLAIAFAIASGVTPERGLYTAVVGGFLIAVFSGSRVQIGGPTGAFIVLVFEIVNHFGYEGLAIATVMAGVLLIIMGVLRLGGIIKFIPYPVTVGFTAGIAVVIASGQIRDSLGLDLSTVPAGFISKFIAYAGVISSINIWALTITVATIAVLVLMPKFVRRIPPSIVVLLAGTAFVSFFKIPVETIGSRFGEVPAGLPPFRLPDFDFSMLPQLVSPAVSIALLGAIESLLSAVVADGMTGRHHRSNAELMAQGIANIAVPFFGGIPATGAIARTATNIRNGGQTPVAGIIHAITVGVVLLAAGQWAAMVPMPVLAGILFTVAYNMSEIHLFRYILRDTTKSDALVLLTTFLLTVLMDLTVAIQVGVVLAALLFMRRMVDVANVRVLQLEEKEDPEIGLDGAALKNIPPGVEVYEINGPFFFGAAHKFASALSRMDRKPSVLIIRTRNVMMLDATGLRVLETLQNNTEKGGPVLIISGIHAQPLTVLMRSKLYNRVGEKNIAADLNAALDRAREIISQNKESQI